MVANGEVDHLVAERVWKEMSRALVESSPQVFFEILRDCGALAKLLPELDNLYGVPQPPQHHPEVDCGVHTMMALQQSVLLSDSARVRFASLVHDLGKATTPEDVLPRHIGHEHRSLDLVKGLCQRLAIPNDYRDLGLAVAEYHTHCHRVTELTPKKLLQTLEKLDAFRRPERFSEFLLACEADARGRTGFESRHYPQSAYFASALQLCQGISAKDVDCERFTGSAVGDQIHQLRVHALKEFKDNYVRTEQGST